MHATLLFVREQRSYEVFELLSARLSTHYVRRTAAGWLLMNVFASSFRTGVRENEIVRLTR